MFRIFLIFCLFHYAQPEECERIECHEIRKIAPEVGQLLLAQSSIDNDNVSESVQQLVAFMDYSFLETNFIANLCGYDNIDLDKFLNFLYIDRRRITNEKQHLIIRYYSTTEFEVEYPVFDKMNFTSVEVFRFQISFQVITRRWKVISVENIGGCASYPKVDTTYIHLNVSERNRYVEEHSYRSPMVEYFQKTILPFTKYIEHPENCSELFYNNFKAVIDKDDGFKYDTTQFMEFMSDFNNLYSYQSSRSAEAYQPRTTIFTQTEEHVVFRTDATFQFVDRYETWFIQVEANYNLDGEKKWKLSRIYMRPPIEVVTNTADLYQFPMVQEVGNLLLAQSSIDNDNLTENIEKLESYMNSGIFGTSFTANICGAGNLQTDLETFLYFMKLERRRIMKTDSFVKPILHYRTPDSFVVTFPVRNKMNYTSWNVFRISITKKKFTLGDKWYIYHLAMDKGCEGFHKNVDLSYISLNYTHRFDESYGKRTEVVENLASRITAIHYIKKSHLRSELFYNNFKAYIDTISELSYDCDQFIEFMDDFKNIKIDPEPRTTTFTQTSDHIVFRIDASFKLSGFWFIQVEANYNLDGEKKWKISRIYMRPPYERVINKKT